VTCSCLVKVISIIRLLQPWPMIRLLLWLQGIMNLCKALLNLIVFSANELWADQNEVISFMWKWKWWLFPSTCFVLYCSKSTPSASSRSPPPFPYDRYSKDSHGYDGSSKRPSSGSSYQGGRKNLLNNPSSHHLSSEPLSYRSTQGKCIYIIIYIYICSSNLISFHWYMHLM